MYDSPRHEADEISVVKRRINIPDGMESHLCTLIFEVDLTLVIFTVWTEKNSRVTGPLTNKQTYQSKSNCTLLSILPQAAA